MIENIFKKKSFILNCDICDTRKVIENIFDGYENIIINANLVIQDSVSKEILMKYPVIMNCHTMIDSDKEIVVTEKMTITKESVIEEEKIYIIKAQLKIEKGSEDVLARFYKAYSLGSARYPESVATMLSNFTFTGDTLIFPDDSIIMDNTMFIDDVFEITSKENALYYTKNKIVISKIDISTIISKKIKFKTKKLVVDKALLAKTLPLFNSDVELVVLPENCSYHNGNADLNTPFVKKYGGNVYVDGSVTVTDESDLGNIEYLFVNGDVNIIKRLQDDFMKLNAVYNNMNFIKGKLLGNCGSITIDKFILETNKDGVSVENFGNAIIKDDVQPELIANRLSIRNGGNIYCTEEQISMVQTVATNVGNIAISKKDDGILMKAITAALSNKIVNADYYVL